MAIEGVSEGSVEGILYDYSNEVSRIVLTPLRPIVGAPDYLRRMRRSQYLREIRKILNWDEEKRLKFLDILTEVVSAPYFSTEEYMKWLERIEEKINELDEFEELKRLKGYLESIDPTQRKKILEISINRLYGDISVLMREIYQLMQKNKDDEYKLKELIVLKATLQLINDLIDLDPEKNLDQVVMYTLRFVAYLMHKIDLRSLFYDLITGVDLVPRKYISERDYEILSKSMYL